MDKTINKIINTSFNLLFFLTPLAIAPFTSELFEFNKIVLVYLFTVILLVLWIVRMIVNKKIIFRRTILGIPIILYIIVNIVSTYYSVDLFTSLFGYYSRFNGGLASTLSYSLLYFIYVSNITKSGVISSIKTILASSFFVSIYAILQHFGIDKSIWEQDVQNRVFSTLGQPNWLAAWVISILPITWAFILSKRAGEKTNNLYYFAYILSFMLFATLLFTKSRSGLLGFGVSFSTFFGIILLISRKKDSLLSKSSFTKSSIIIFFLYLSLVFLVGTPWTSNISTLLNQSEKTDISKETVVGPTLETGGTESGEIRKIVWKGAYDIWMDNPYLGTGVETFAYSYYQYRPFEHNLVSEWDFLYNKAHNEYLNLLATTGALGLFTYALVVIGSFIVFIRTIKFSLSKESSMLLFLPISFLSGFLGVLITNIFGFSVVITSLMCFMLPAFSVSLQQKKNINYDSRNLGVFQKVSLLLILFILVFLISKVFFYWYADVLYAKGKKENNLNEYTSAKLHLTEALNYQPWQAVYYDELAQTDLSIALYMYTVDELEEYEKYKESAIESSEKSITLSPINMNLRRNNAGTYLKLSAVDENYLPISADVINKAIILAPTDAKLYYNLAVVMAKMNMIDEAIVILNKTIDMKTNYRDARYALGVLYLQENEFDLAKKEFEYILKFIAPDDKRTQEELDKINP